MKTIALFFILFSNSFLFSQTQKIKIKKEYVKEKLTQANIGSHAIFCNKYFGDITKDDLYKNNRITVSNNMNDLRVINFELLFKQELGKIFGHEMANDTIGLAIRAELLKARLGSKIFIDNIKAVSKNNDTIFLNPISLRLTE